MKAVVERYLNEIVSLTVLALMVVALVAGQADATGHDAVRNDPRIAVVAADVSIDALLESTVFRAKFAIRLGLDDLRKLDLDKESIEAIHDILEIRLKRAE